MSLPHGSQRAIAKHAGISESYLSDIIAEKRNCRSDLANKLVAAAKTIGIETSVFDWQFPGASMVLSDATPEE